MLLYVRKDKIKKMHLAVDAKGARVCEGFSSQGNSFQGLGMALNKALSPAQMNFTLT